MKIKILNSANQDLIEGYWFYEKQTKSLGAYFLDTLFSDIDSLKIYAGIHSINFDKYHRLLSKTFCYLLLHQRRYSAYLCYSGLSAGSSMDKKKTEIKTDNK